MHKVKLHLAVQPCACNSIHYKNYSTMICLVKHLHSNIQERGPGSWASFWSNFTCNHVHWNIREFYGSFGPLLLQIHLTQLHVKLHSHDIYPYTFFSNNPNILMFLPEDNVFIQGAIKNKPAIKNVYVKKEGLVECIKPAPPSK